MLVLILKFLCLWQIIYVKGYGIRVAISTNQNILFYILFHANMSLSFSISWKYVLVVEFLEQIASCK